jgi:hypothetical protein
MNPLALSSSLLLLLGGVLVGQAPGDWLFADRATGFTQGSLFYMPERRSRGSGRAPPTRSSGC